MDLSTASLDAMSSMFAIVRSPGETDAQLRIRILAALRYQPHGIPSPTLHLWLLLAKLGLRSVPRDVFPAGIDVGPW